MSKNNHLFEKTWALGFVQGGMDAVFSGNPMKIDVVKNPYKDRWFADPFVLDVTNDQIQLLVEEARYKHPIGRIARLIIDRHSMTIVQCDILLEGVHHLSFPNIFRHQGRVFVNPECCRDGNQKLYEYDPTQGTLKYSQVICNEGVWDATITNLLGGCKLIGGYHNHSVLDIFDWNEGQGKFLLSQSIESSIDDKRLAGAIIQYNGTLFCPTQDCIRGYGKGIFLRPIESHNGQIILHEGRLLKSPVHRYQEGMHTINEYKGVVVVDLHGWRYEIGRYFYGLGRLLFPKKK